MDDETDFERASELQVRVSHFYSYKPDCMQISYHDCQWCNMSFVALSFHQPACSNNPLSHVFTRILSSVIVSVVSLHSLLMSLESILLVFTNLITILVNYYLLDRIFEIVVI